jgi:sialic acid synthase SpsE
MSGVYIIAEAGSCHEGDLGRAMRLIAAAGTAGADAVKFQYWSSPEAMRARRHVTQKGAYERGSVKVDWLPTLQAYARQLSSPLDFLCTAYLPQDIATVAPYVDAFKVSSFEATPAFIALHTQYGKPVYVSTGLGKAPPRHLGYSDYVLQQGRPQSNFRTMALHCVSAYPCPPQDANLRVLLQHGGYAGYSDHTRNVLTGAVAVGAGARVLEVHFRLDDTPPTCPDYCVSLTPGELQQYITNARLAWTLLGTGVKRVMPSEEGNVVHAVGESPW